ncbi:hypothetical protein PUN28_016517 [Cardiocondyla obscurior]|uniref:Serine/threonine-protein phosphatase 4 regulatory subunit 2 n=1 Tax=Cardiocondyla obscurior TaxID=286306 RepID=A0AAW2EQ43_9HYME
MENLEEVLQALDEFQKMRPSVIPQELEDYLCWVAKTGDPVYQWPLIKTLVREKLTRVMTDFYESCTTLEITPCPNVDHFNYDTMKSNLLERLESFANAPFTVQRICELLTAPRKEYNRVDKFMRAIEKNILVVSTREPGPITRRGETADGMVNGSVEEDTTSITQQQPLPSSPSQPQPQPQPPPSPSSSPSQLQPQPFSQSSQTQPSAQSVQSTTQDVEMDWEKDCNSTVTISVHTVENEPPLLHGNVIPPTDSANALAKNLFTDEAVREKFEQATSRTDVATSNYITSVSDFSTISNLNLQPHGSTSETITTIPVVQNLPAVETVPDNPAVPDTDVSVATVNEDSNSQSNLDIENEEIAATVNATVSTMTTTASTVTVTTATSTMSTSATAAASAAATTTVTVVATVIPLTTDTTRKLQAAFQAKHFDSTDNKCTDKFHDKTTDLSILSNTEEEIGRPVENEETTSTKSNTDHMNISEISRGESRLTENLLQTDIQMRTDTLLNSTENVIGEKAPDKLAEEEPSILRNIDEENLRSINGHNVNAITFVGSQSMEKNSAVTSDESMSAVIVSNSEALYKTEKPETHSKEISTIVSSTECFLHDQPTSQKTESAEAMDKVLEEDIPTIASSVSNTNGKEIQKSQFNDDNLNIMEISNNKMTLVRPLVSEPINIVEKSKEMASVIEKIDSVPSTDETTESSDNTDCRSPKDDTLTGIQDDSLTNLQGNKPIACIAMKESQSSIIESITCRKESVELMEVDDEESLSTFQQDEPRKQETMEELPES